MKALLLGISFLFAAVMELSAKTAQVQGENITIEVPDSWTLAKMDGSVFYATAPDNVSAITIKKFPNDQGKSITPSFVAGLKKGMTDQGPKMGGTLDVTAEKSLTMGGAPAYEVQTVLTLPAKKVQMQNYVVATHDVYYLFSLQTVDPTKNDELQGLANSFRFTVPPVLPDNSLNDFEAGERGGRFIGYALPLLVLAVIIKIIVRKSRRAA